MFSVGELVVHPMHGAGVIDSIVQERIAGVTQDYYVFKMPMSGLILKIPVSNSEVIGVRPIITSEAAEKLLAEIPTLEVEVNRNWNKRYQENMSRLKSGDIYEVARVIRGLMRRERHQSLSTGERKMLHTAKQIMLSELVLAEKMDYQELEARVDRAMMQTAKGMQRGSK